MTNLKGSIMLQIAEDKEKFSVRYQFVCRAHPSRFFADFDSLKIHIANAHHKERAKLSCPRACCESFVGCDCADCFLCSGDSSK